MQMSLLNLTWLGRKKLNTKIDNAGNMSLSDFKYVDENGKTLNISNIVQFDPSQVNLKAFNASTGKSDLSVTEY
jgi:hypothetical protein